jgi:hypothetical protein
MVATAYELNYLCAKFQEGIQAEKSAKKIFA